MMTAILKSAILDSDTAILDAEALLSYLRFTQNTLTPLWIWLKQIQSDSNSFILTSLDDVSHLEFCHLGFNHFEQIKTSLIHCHSTWGWQPSWILPSWIQPFCIKNFTHSFWLILMMAVIFNSAMLDSATAILDSDTLLSFMRFTQKHSHSTLTLTQTNSIWLIWWWHPSWILLPWIQPFCTKLWLKLIQSDSNSFILT